MSSLQLIARRFVEHTRWFSRVSHQYIGPYTWKDRLFWWPLAWCRFMWLSRKDITRKVPRKVQSWTCFHCGEIFTTYGAARDHFGVTPDAEAGCLIDRVALEEGGKPERGRGLLMALRKVEARLALQELALHVCEGALRTSREERKGEAEAYRIQGEELLRYIQRTEIAESRSRILEVLLYERQ